MTKGKLIVMEGVDGCGKSTHASLLVEWLKGQGKDVLHTKEPSKGKIGIILREYLKEDAPPLVDALLFTADRAEHIENEINPALEKGQIIVSERYHYSTIVYQTAQGLDMQWLENLNAFAPKPDLVILLDLRPDIAVKRSDRDEKFETLEFLTKVRANYLKLAERENFSTVDASKGKEKVQKEIRKAISKALNI